MRKRLCPVIAYDCVPRHEFDHGCSESWLRPVALSSSEPLPVRMAGLIYVRLLAEIVLHIPPGMFTAEEEMLP
jgi:hypothetical protein